jgi:hypothetical protein
MAHRFAERRSVSLTERFGKKNKTLSKATRVFIDFFCKTLAG